MALTFPTDRTGLTPPGTGPLETGDEYDADGVKWVYNADLPSWKAEQPAAVTNLLEQELFTAAPNATVNAVQLAVGQNVGTTNTALVLSPKGTGALIAGPVPDGTAVGGNARGANSIDLQVGRTAAAQVAHGASSVVIGTLGSAGDYSIAIGASNQSDVTGGVVVGYGSYTTSNFAVVIGAYGRANQTRNVVIGYNAIAYGVSAIAIGDGALSICQNGIAIGSGAGAGTWGTYEGISIGTYNNVRASYGVGLGYGCAVDYNCTHSAVVGQNGMTRNAGVFCYSASQAFSNVLGDCQTVDFLRRAVTTDDTPTVLLHTDAEFGNKALYVAPNFVISFIATITGIKTDGSAVAMYVRKGCIKNVAGTTSLVGSIETLGTDIEDSAGTAVAITANDTNDTLDITVTGIAAETWRWTARISGTEHYFGANV